MGYCRICPLCGAHLDPGERCDCKEVQQPISGTSIDYPGGNIHRGNHENNAFIRTVYIGRSFTND